MRWMLRGLRRKFSYFSKAFLGGMRIKRAGSASVLFLIYSPKNVIMGVALATLLSWVVYSIGMGILVKRRLNIKTKLSLVVKPLIASFVMVGIIYLLKSQFKDITILNGAILIICGIIVYFATLFAIKGINKEDYFIIEILKSKIFLPKNYKES